MPRRVQTLVNQISVPGYGMVPVAGTVVIIQDLDFQRIPVPLFTSNPPKLRDLGLSESAPSTPSPYATTIQLAGLATQIDSLVDSVTAALQTANNAATAAATAQSSASNAFRATSTATLSSSQSSSAVTSLTAKVNGLASDLTAAQTALSALATSYAGKETAGVAANLIASHAAAADPHVQYQTQARTDARYSQLGHVHAIADVSNLQNSLAGKENTGVAAAALTTHTSAPDPHTQYQTAARGDARYAALSHIHGISAITGLQTALDGKEVTGAAIASMNTHLSVANPHSQYCTVTSATALQSAITVLQGRAVTIQQPAAFLLPSIGLGGTTTLTVAWPSIMPHANYGVVFMFDMGVTLIGGVTAQLVTGSRTMTDCKVTVKTAMLVAAGSVKLNVLGIAT